MEMCYDGALVMPSSYAVMDEEEMTYVEGGAIKVRVNSKTCNRIAAIMCVGAGVCAVAGAICSIITEGLSLVAGLALAGGLMTIASGLFWYASTYDVIELGLKSNSRAYAKGIC